MNFELSEDLVEIEPDAHLQTNGPASAIRIPDSELGETVNEQEQE